MIFHLLRIFAASALLASIGIAQAGEDSAPTGGHDYVRFTGDDKRGKLETVVVTMKNEAGVQVELIGAIHIADKAYYAALTVLFKTYEALLFELVDGQALKEGLEPKVRKTSKPAQEKPADNSPATVPEPKPQQSEDLASEPKPRKSEDLAFTILRGMMTGLGSYLRLEYQTDGIDYQTKNFVHADVSLAEFQRLQAEHGESFLTLFQKAIEAQLRGEGPQAKDPKPAQMLLALLGDSSGIKIAMAQMLGSVEDHGEALGFGADSVIVGERDRVALEVFDKEVAAGRKNLGIFYGAAHLPDMETRLEKRGYKRTGERWITAWDIKPRVDELAK